MGIQPSFFHIRSIHENKVVRHLKVDKINNFCVVVFGDNLSATIERMNGGDYFT